MWSVLGLLFILGCVVFDVWHERRIERQMRQRLSEFFGYDVY